jgi:hypothetical protein
MKKEIYLTISYKVTDHAKGIEESDNFSCFFDKMPKYEEILEVFCTGTDWSLEENRETLSVSFYASTENNESLDCDIEW